MSTKSVLVILNETTVDTHLPTQLSKKGDVRGSFRREKLQGSEAFKLELDSFHL